MIETPKIVPGNRDHRNGNVVRRMMWCLFPKLGRSKLDGREKEIGEFLKKGVSKNFLSKNYWMLENCTHIFYQNSQSRMIF